MKKEMNNVQKLTLYAIHVAVIIVLSFLPIQTLGLEISLCMVPIAVGAVLLGPTGGAVLGGIYGVISLLQCFGLFKASAFGAALLGINPVLTGITCILPRVLCGWIAGLIFLGLSKFDKTKFLGHVVACVACPILNTVLFMSAIMLFFGQSDLIQGFMNTLNIYNPFLFVCAFVGINGIIEAGCCFVVGTAVAKTCTSVINKYA